MEDEDEAGEDSPSVITEPEIRKISDESSLSLRKANAEITSTSTVIESASMKDEIHIADKVSLARNGKAKEWNEVKQEDSSVDSKTFEVNIQDDETRGEILQDGIKSEKEFKRLSKTDSLGKGKSTSLGELEKENKAQVEKLKTRVQSKGPKQCQRRFREMIGKRELRNDQLEKQQGDLRQRIDVLECSMPAVMVWNIWRMAQGASPSSLQRVIEKQFRGPASGEVYCPSTPSRHFDCRVREVEAERKQAQKRAEEARSLWTAKTATLQERKKQLEEAKKIQDERKERINQLTKEAKELREALDAVEANGFCEAGECGDIQCKQRWLDKVSSSSSIRSTDVECLERLQELAESELSMKRQIADLERREEAYMRTLQQADELWSKMEGDTASTVSALQDQLDMKTVANQQLANRICELEDELEKLRTRMASCRTELEKFMSIERIEAIIGKDDDFAEVADKAELAKAKVEHRMIGREDDIAGVTDEEMLAKVDLIETSMQAISLVEDKMISAKPDVVDLALDRPDLIKVEDAQLGIQPEDFVQEDQRLQEAMDYLAQLGSLEELDYDDDYGVCAPDFACNDEVFTETGMEDETLTGLESLGATKMTITKRDVTEGRERGATKTAKTTEVDVNIKDTLQPESLYKDVVEEPAFDEQLDQGIKDKEKVIYEDILEDGEKIVYKDVLEDEVQAEDLSADVSAKIVHDRVEGESIPEETSTKQIIQDASETITLTDAPAEMVSRVPELMPVYGTSDLRDPQIDRENVIVSRKDLLSWLDTANLIRGTIAKCSDCQVVKSNADNLAKNIAALTLTEVDDVIDERVLHEKVELDTKDETKEKGVIVTELKPQAEAGMKVESVEAKEAIEVGAVEVIEGDRPMSEIPTDMTRRLPESKKEDEILTEAEIDELKLEESIPETTDGKVPVDLDEDKTVTEETKPESQTVPPGIETVVESKEGTIDERQLVEEPAEPPGTPLKSVEENLDDVSIAEQVAQKLVDIETPEERVEAFGEGATKEDQQEIAVEILGETEAELENIEVKEVPVEEIEEATGKLASKEEEMEMEVSKIDEKIEESIGLMGESEIGRTMEVAVSVEGEKIEEVSLSVEEARRVEVSEGMEGRISLEPEEIEKEVEVADAERIIEVEVEKEIAVSVEAEEVERGIKVIDKELEDVTKEGGLMVEGVEVGREKEMLPSEADEEAERGITLVDQELEEVPKEERLMGERIEEMGREKEILLSEAEEVAEKGIVSVDEELEEASKEGRLIEERREEMSREKEILPSEAEEAEKGITPVDQELEVPKEDRLLEERIEEREREILLSEAEEEAEKTIALIDQELEDISKEERLMEEMEKEILPSQAEEEAGKEIRPIVHELEEVPKQERLMEEKEKEAEREKEVAPSEAEEAETEITPIDQELEEVPKEGRLMEEGIIVPDKELEKEEVELIEETVQPLAPRLVDRPYLAIAEIEEEEKEPTAPVMEHPCICKPDICSAPRKQPPQLITKVEITQTEFIQTQTIQVITQTESNVATQTLPAQKIIKRMEHSKFKTQTKHQESEIPERLPVLKKLLKDQSTVTTANTASQTEKSSLSRLKPPMDDQRFATLFIPDIPQSTKAGGSYKLSPEQELRSINYGRKSDEMEKVECNCCVCGKLSSPTWLPIKTRLNHSPTVKTGQTVPMPRKIASPGAGPRLEQERLCPECKLKRLKKENVRSDDPPRPLKIIKGSTCDREVCTCSSTSTKGPVSSQKKVREKRDQSSMAKIPKGRTDSEQKRKEERCKKNIEKQGEDSSLGKKNYVEDCICYEITETGELKGETRLKCSCMDSD